MLTNSNITYLLFKTLAKVKQQHLSINEKFAATNYFQLKKCL